MACLTIKDIEAALNACVSVRDWEALTESIQIPEVMVLMAYEVRFIVICLLSLPSPIHSI